MTKDKVFKAYMHPFAEEVVEITSEDNENTFWKTSETNLLSLLMLYVNRTTNASQLKEMIIELKKLLENINTPDDLKQLSESLLDKDADVKNYGRLMLFSIRQTDGKSK